jgi:uncharacterized membrane protein
MKKFEQLLIIMSWTVIIGLSIYFFVETAAPYLSGHKSESLINNPYWVVLHLIGGTLALSFGPVQFSKWIRNKYLSFHRLTGKIYIVGSFIAGLSALKLSLISKCIPCRVPLFILAVLVIATTLSAWWSIKNRNIKAHQQFMVRSYICILSFVAVRIGGIIPMTSILGQIEDPTFSRTVNEYFFAFVPLLIGEVFLIWLPTLMSIKEKMKVRQTASF